MGKRLISQRRGKGSIYKSPKRRHRGEAKHLKIKKGRGIIKEIIHDPGRTAPLARVRYGEKDILMIAPDGLQIGQKVDIGSAVKIDRGNTLPIGEIPIGTLIYNVEAKPGDGGKFVRSAGTSAVIVGHGEKTVIQLPSGKFKSLNPECMATIGVIAGSGRKEKPFAKAGKKFHAYKSRAKRSFKVSGVAMNPVDHPHGGGSHQHVGTPSTVSRHVPPGRKVGRLSPKKKRKKRRR